MNIDLTSLTEGLPDNRRKKAMNAFTSLVAWAIIVLVCLIVVGGLAWVTQVIWRSVLGS